MNMTQRRWSAVLGIVLAVTCAGCVGAQGMIRKDWETRSVIEVPRNQPAHDAPLPVTVEDFECTRDKTRLEKLILKQPGNSYYGNEEAVAWRCLKENVYWVFFQKGTGGSLQIQWFGPFDVPVKPRSQRSEVRS